MRSRFSEILIGGFVATFAFLLVAFLESLTGVLTLNPPTFMMVWSRGSVWIGLFLHLIAGWLFAVLYAVFFIRLLSWIKSDLWRGVVYGILLAVLIRIFISMIAEWEYVGHISYHIIALIIAYAAYGLVLGLIVRSRPQVD